MGAGLLIPGCACCGGFTIPSYCCSAGLPSQIRATFAVACAGNCSDGWDYLCAAGEKIVTCDYYSTGFGCLIAWRHDPIEYHDDGTYKYYYYLTSKFKLTDDEVVQTGFELYWRSFWKSDGAPAATDFTAFGSCAVIAKSCGLSAAYDRECHGVHVSGTCTLTIDVATEVATP